MIRHLKLIEYALSTLVRRRWKNLSLLLVYSLTIAAIASVLLFSQALREEAALLLAGAPELLVQRLLAGRHDAIPEEYAAKSARCPGSPRSGRAPGATCTTPSRRRTTP